MNTSQVEDLKRLLNEYDVKVVFKSDGYEVWWHKVAAWFVEALFWVLRACTLGGFDRTFAEDYNTNFGRHIYLTDSYRPLDFYHPATYRMIRHELLHILQQEDLGKVRYALEYLLFPLPAVWTGRARLELEAYTQDLLVQYERFGYVPDVAISRVVAQFSSPGYLFMRPFESEVREDVLDIVEQIEAGEITGLWPYKPEELA